MCDGKAKQKGKSKDSEAMLQERMFGQHDLTSTTVPSFQTRPQHGGLVWVDRQENGSTAGNSDQRCIHAKAAGVASVDLHGHRDWNWRRSRLTSGDHHPFGPPHSPPIHDTCQGRQSTLYRSSLTNSVQGAIELNLKPRANEQKKGASKKKVRENCPLAGVRLVSPAVLGMPTMLIPNNVAFGSAAVPPSLHRHL